MALREDFETVIYRQKMAHKAWLNRVFMQGVRPTDEVSELVWELLVTYGESIDDIDRAGDDIYKTAYELAETVLSDMPVDHVFRNYRDSLLDAVIEFSGGKGPDPIRAMVRFTNLISSAICEAYSDRLRKTIRHRHAEGISNELKIAKQIQSALLPKVIPSIDGFDFAGRLKPATEIGGDYWSIKHHKKDGIVTLKLADITGHGIAAATLVAAVKFISGGYYKGSESAAEVIARTNTVLTQETPHEILVSMVYAWLKPATCELSMVNAGHAPVFLCHDGLCEDVPLTGPLMGISEDSEYGERKFKLKKDDIVFFGSDGIIEAGVGQQFGLERLKMLVMNNTHLTADEIADKVVDSVMDYARQPNDDISLLLVKVTSDPPERE
ncbi:MAG: serine/threonine-protein phosphatase [Armatimonadetes bacterium]|nr:serine/threonine-protein phosphatase [Armatimonadota bacterium]